MLQGLVINACRVSPAIAPQFNVQTASASCTCAAWRSGDADNRLEDRAGLYIVHFDTPGSGAMAAAHSRPSTDTVSFALSGDYDDNRPVLIDALDETRTISRKQAIKLIASLAGSFRPNSTVCLHLWNDILYPIIFLAVFASKCRWTGTNPAYTANELEHHFRASHTTYVITTQEQLEAVRAGVENSSTNAEIIILTDILKARPEALPDCCRRQCNRPDHISFRTLHDLIVDRPPEALFEAIQDIDPESIATLMSTSGTTGRPKMAARTHASMVHESWAAADNHVVKDYAVRRLYCTPIFHSFSTGEMIINSLRLGHPSYYMRRFDRVAWPQKVEEHGITETLMPPPVFNILVNLPASHPQIKGLRTIYTGGAALVPELKKKFEDIFKSQDVDPPRCVQVWGMTEGGWFTTFKYPEDDTTSSAGRPLDGFEVKVDESVGSTLSSGQKTGEVLVRSPSIMSGYFGQPKETAAAFCDGWLKTGDVGYVRDGKVYLLDRRKDLVKVNGFQVAPAEIEDALIFSKHVADVGVIGRGEDINEHPLAFVVKGRNSPDITPQILKDHLLTRLARYKVSTCEIRFIAEIPKSATGKILKKDLKKIADEQDAGEGLQCT